MRKREQKEHCARGKKPRRLLFYRLAFLCMLAVCACALLRLWFVASALHKEAADLQALSALVHADDVHGTDANGAGTNGADEQTKAADLSIGAEANVSEEAGTQQKARARVIGLEQYQTLYEMNSDMLGWLRIDGTRIDYPVMQSKEDAEYYLHRNFEKKYAYSGLPFLDVSCTMDESRFLMIYGHHMKSGSMFTDLMKYEKQAFFEKHPLIYLDSLDEAGTYRVFSAFYADLNAPQTSFHYEYLPKAGNSEAEARYAAQLKAASLYDTGVSVEDGARVIVLSTCSYHAKEGRFVVAAVEE